MNSTYVHVFLYTSHCTSSTLDTLSTFVCKFDLLLVCLVQPEIVVVFPTQSIRSPWSLANFWPYLARVWCYWLRHDISKAQLAERIHGFEHTTPPPAAPFHAPNNATRLMVNVDETTGPATAFSEMQITQLRSLISAAVHNERVGPLQAPVLVGGPLLSPATPHP